MWGYIEASATFCDDDDTMTNIMHLPPGDTWRLWMGTTNRDAVVQASVEITDTTRGSLQSLDEFGLAVDSISLSETGETVFGEVTNDTGEAVDYIEAYARFYDSDGYVRWATTTNMTDLLPDDTWRFELDFVTTAPDDPQVAEYDVRFSTTAGV